MTSTALLPASRLLNPRSVAVVGASEDQTKFGGRLFRMLLKHNYQGQVYPVNPSRATLFDVKAYPSLDVLPESPEMVVLVLPSTMIKDQVKAAGEAGAQCVIIISSGFSDAGDEGARLESEIVALAHSYGMRLIGPNCLGLISAVNNLVLCSSPILAKDVLPVRPVGFISQSGALMTTYFDRTWTTGGGFTHGISVGNQADLELCDFVDFLIDDQHTQVICAYIEGIKDPEAFRQVARRARQAGKPWLAVKAGRSSAGSAAAFSHTASVAGDHAVFASVCRDEGVTLVDDMGAMFVLAGLLAEHPTAQISNVAIVTPSGGGGALAADALAESGVALSAFSTATNQQLRAHFPDGQGNNPIDFGARTTADSATVAKAIIQALNNDAGTDMIFVTVAMCPPEWTNALVQAVADQRDTGKCKPVLFALDAGVASNALREKLESHRISYANSTAEAVKAMGAWTQRANFISRSEPKRPEDCGPILGFAQLKNELNEEESKALLAKYGLPVAAGKIAIDQDQAAQAGEQLGYPLVMKIMSPDIVHKTEAGGVMLNIRNQDEVRRAYDQLLVNAEKAVPGARIDGVSVQQMASGDLELIVGAKLDVQFGPVVVFGGGGILVELLPERVVACAPLHPDDVRRLLSTLSVGTILQGYRGRGLDMEGVVDAIVRASWLAHDLADHDFELDINPLIVASQRCYAVDARLKTGNEH
ncbi:acetate--CoA ligase family protein [Alcaligenaceae bacterium]|nr:acetate--CoA ligase family protein [Alcaligenaceae bacterium]